MGFGSFFTWFFPSSDNGYVVFSPHLIDMLNYMDSFSNTELSLHPQNKPHLDVVYASFYVYMYTQLCLTLCDPNSSLPGSSVHEILLAIMLEWVAMPSSRESSQPRYWTQVSCIAGKFFTTWAPRKDIYIYTLLNSICYLTIKTRVNKASV